MRYFKFTYGTDYPGTEQVDYLAFIDEEFDNKTIEDYEVRYAEEAFELYNYLDKELVAAYEDERYADVEWLECNFMDKCYCFSEEITKEEYEEHV